ncbi:unnamed protein product [Camellia sinensis]
MGPNQKVEMGVSGSLHFVWSGVDSVISIRSQDNNNSPTKPIQGGNSYFKQITGGVFVKISVNAFCTFPLC